LTKKIREEAKKSKITSSETEEEIDHVDPIFLGEAIERFKRKLHFSATSPFPDPNSKSPLDFRDQPIPFDVPVN